MGTENLCFMDATMDCECMWATVCPSTDVPQPFDWLNQSCEGIVLWRGHFDSSGTEKSVSLTINGGAGKVSCIQAPFKPHTERLLCS